VDPDALLRPVGPEPPRVYWLRRGFLLLLVAVLVVAVAESCSGGGTPTHGSPTAHDTPGVVPTTPPATPTVQKCTKADLSVEAATDAEAYPPGTLPHLSAIVRNSSATTCRFVTAPAARSWVIMSGADRVWASADCTISGALARQQLAAGKTIAYGLVWDRHRSTKGCPSGTPEAQPGTYQLLVTVNGVDADPVVFHLTS
jgi:hypothetical protein